MAQQVAGNFPCDGSVVRQHRPRAVFATRRSPRSTASTGDSGWGRNRIEGAVQSRPDWCISRQRSWGVPIPAFYDAQGEPILDARIVRNTADLVQENGSNVWFERELADLWAAVKPDDWDGAEAVGKSTDTLTCGSTRFVLACRTDATQRAGPSGRRGRHARRVAGRLLPRGQRPASRLVSIVAAPVARRQRRCARTATF